MSKFVTQKKILIFIHIVCLIFVLGIFQVTGFYFASGNDIDVAKAIKPIKFSQEIVSQDPVDSYESIEKERDADVANSKYRVTTSNSSNMRTKEELWDQEVVKSPVTSLKGKAMYPNSLVYLEINSEKYITVTRSDSNGNWSYVNYVDPFEQGGHTVEMYNFAPYEMNGKTDVYVEKYAFSINPDSEFEGKQVVSLDEVQMKYEEEEGDDDLGDLLMSDTSGGAYYFEMMVPIKEQFDPGDQIGIQLYFNSFGKNDGNRADMKYDVFAIDEEKLSISKVSSSEDYLAIGEDNSFVKKINLKDDLVGGAYALKATANIGEERYVQVMTFYVHGSHMVKLGALNISESKLNKIIVLNLIFAFAIVMIIFSLIIREYRRFHALPTINEDDLKKYGHF